MGPAIVETAEAAAGAAVAREPEINGRLIHSNSRYGENLAKGSSPDFSMYRVGRRPY